MSQLASQKLRKRYKSRTVVQDVSLEVSSGEVVGLLGPNGAGKTTCFYMIVGLIPADAGSIHLDHTELTHLPIHRRARLGISYLPQENSVFRRLTVEENVQAILELQGLAAGEIEARLAELLKDLNIAHLRKHAALSLSGGERRRLEIARALGTRPTFILLDEHPAHHQVPEGTRHRGAHNGPQRAGDARHLRPRLHHQRGRGARLRPPRGDCL